MTDKLRLPQSDAGKPPARGKRRRVTTQKPAPVPVDNGSTPDPVIALEAECQAAEAALDVAYDAFAKAEGLNKPNTPELKREFEAARERWFRLVAKLAAMPAVSVAGIAIKLNYVRRSVEVSDADYDADMIRTALHAVEQLAKPSEAKPDPAVLAATKHRRAADHFNSMSEAGGETTMPDAFEKASDHTLKLAEVFADAIPTSPEGARQKLLDVIDSDFGKADLEETLSGRHLRTVIAYLENTEPLTMRATPPEPEPDPVLPIWDEIPRLRAESEGASGDDDAIEALTEREQAAERRMASTRAVSLKGLHAKIDTYFHAMPEIRCVPADERNPEEGLFYGIWKDSARLALADGS